MNMEISFNFRNISNFDYALLGLYPIGYGEQNVDLNTRLCFCTIAKCARSDLIIHGTVKLLRKSPVAVRSCFFLPLAAFKEPAINYGEGGGGSQNSTGRVGEVLPLRKKKGGGG